jgi:hypothetical protein
MNEMPSRLLYSMYKKKFIRKMFLICSFQKLFTFKDDLYTLYTRPRLQFPAWYILTQEHLTMSKRRALAQQLCSIIDLFTAPKYGE